MPVSFDLESWDGVAIGTAEGALTLQEIKAAAAEMWQRVGGPRYRILWDLRASRFAFQAREVRHLAEHIKESSPEGELRTAFVVSEDLEFGLVRMFEVFRETPSAQTAVFREFEPALAWLTEP